MRDLHLQLEFVSRGTRNRPGFPLHYRSRCGRYEVVKCDQIGGVDRRPIVWHAAGLNPSVIISKHRSRRAAEEACRKHLRATHNADLSKVRKRNRPQSRRVRGANLRVLSPPSDE